MGPSFGAVNGTLLAGAHSHSTLQLTIAAPLPRQLTAGPQLRSSGETFLYRGSRIGAVSPSYTGRSSGWSSRSSASCNPPSKNRPRRSSSAPDLGPVKLQNILGNLQSFGVRRKVELNNPWGRKFDARMGSDDGDFLTHGTSFRTRKVVEHLALFKMKDNLTEEQEKDMLDNLWTLQYMIRNVLFTTVGRLVQKTPEGYTHGLLSRFPTKEALAEFLESAVRWRVSQDYIYPYYDGNIFVDFEADVEDDMEPLFRRGEDFEEGLEQLMLFKLKDGVSTDAHDKFLSVAKSLPQKYEDLVQLTAGFNLSSQSSENFSHEIVARLPSEEAYLEFDKALQADASWTEVMQLFDTSKTIVANYFVSPVGKRIL